MPFLNISRRDGISPSVGIELHLRGHQSPATYQWRHRLMREWSCMRRGFHPDGDSIPINVDPFNVKDETPTDTELRRIVRTRLKRGRAGGASQIKAEHIIDWLDGAELEDEDPDHNVGAGEKWQLFVELIQEIWVTGRIPTQMLWVVIVLIPKGSGDEWGIGLLDPIWKVLECLIDDRLNLIRFHDCLHGFVRQRGCGTADRM
jgi:hypothetical protein